MKFKNSSVMVVIIFLLISIVLSSACTSGEGDKNSSGIINYTENCTASIPPAGSSSGGNEPFIYIDPVLWSQQDQVLAITGTTSFPAGTSITIFSGLAVHPCPTSPPGVIVDTKGVRSLCNGNCSTEITESVAYAVYGEGNNTWSCLVNTTGWCCCESYFIRAEYNADNETIQDTKEFRFSG